MKLSLKFVVVFSREMTAVCIYNFATSNYFVLGQTTFEPHYFFSSHGHGVIQLRFFSIGLFEEFGRANNLNCVPLLWAKMGGRRVEMGGFYGSRPRRKN